MKKAVMQRKRYTFLSVFLSLLLLLQSGAVAVPMRAAAEQITAEQITATEEASIVSERAELRTEFEKHFELSDGTFMAVAYADPVHEQKADGSWQEIDNTLSLVGGRYESGAENFKASFAAASTASQLVSLEANDHTLSWSLTVLKTNPNHQVMSAGESVSLMNVNSGAEPSAVAPSLSAAAVENPLYPAFALMTDSQKIESAVSASKLTYANAFGSGITVEYGIRAYGVKENVILQNANTGFRGYKMHIASQGLTAQKDEYNTVTFTDSEGNVQFTVQAPYMMDSADNVSGDISVVLTQTSTGYDITYIPNAAWLASATYPVVIDPQTTSSQDASNLLDTYTYEGDSTSNAVTRQNLDRMYVGNKSVSGTRVKHIGYFQFLNLPTIPATGSFLEATVVLKCPNGTSTSQPFDLHVVTETWVTNTLTWSTKPNYDSTAVCVAAARDTSTDYVHFVGTGTNRALSNTIGQWYSGYQTNYGFMVCYTSASASVADYNALYTSNCSTTSVRPYMVVTYDGIDTNYFVTAGTYYIRNTTTGKYLTAQGGGISGSNVILASLDYTRSQAQQWIVEQNSDGYYRIYNAANPSAMLAVKSISTNGTVLYVNTSDQGYRSEFGFIYNMGSGIYHIRSRSSNGGIFLSASGTNVVLGGTAQSWVFKNIGHVPTDYFVDYDPNYATIEHGDLYVNCLSYAMTLPTTTFAFQYTMGTNAQAISTFITTYFNETDRPNKRSVREVSKTETLRADEYRIALRVGDGDYHFIIQCEDGSWAHKPGACESENLGFIDPDMDEWYFGAIYPETEDRIYYAAYDSKPVIYLAVRIWP